MGMEASVSLDKDAPATNIKDSLHFKKLSDGRELVEIETKGGHHTYLGYNLRQRLPEWYLERLLEL